ncbi:hypothetical protein H8D76_01865 [Candidatus Bathyarchaeota archaeon]|nr:hypothetical protein [Candidatus Bathyarchaeota archaeon]
MNIPYTAQERKHFLDDYYKTLERSRELDYETSINEDAPDSVISELDSLREKLVEAWSQYRMSTPVVPLSRCPFTNQVVYHSLDIYGLDGMWWDSQVPIRPVDSLPSSFFMLTGALKPSGEYEKAPIIVKPGPEAPYVIPEILSTPGIKATITTVKVGAHTAYPIFYFIEDWEKAVEPMNSWGANYWSFVNADMEYGYNEYGILRDDPELDFEEEDDIEEEEIEYTFDFDLKKWVDNGELLWIQPKDPVFTLRKGASGCPYLNIQGSRDFVVIYDGEVVEEEEEN